MRAATLWAGLSLGALLLGACSQPEYLEIDPKELNFHRRGDKVWARVIAKDSKGHTYAGTKGVWSSSDPKVATVDEVGHVESTGPGRATISVKSGKLSAEAPVEVVTVEKLVVDPPELLLDMESGNKTVKVTALDSQGHVLPDRKPLSRCTDQKLCSATDTTVFPLNPGKTAVVFSLEGVKAEVPVTITEKPPKK